MIWVVIFSGTLVYFWFSALVRAIRSKETMNTDSPRTARPRRIPLRVHPGLGLSYPPGMVDNIGACVDAILARITSSSVGGPR